MHFSLVSVVSPKRNGNSIERAFQSLVLVEGVLRINNASGLANNGKLHLCRSVLSPRIVYSTLNLSFERWFQFIGCLIFSVLIYTITGQPFELFRFNMFFAISLFVTIVGQSIGLMVGAWFDVVVSHLEISWMDVGHRCFLPLELFCASDINWLLLICSSSTIERDIFGTNNHHTDDDVCWIRCDVAWFAQLHEMGKPHIIHAIRARRLCRRYLRRESHDFGVWRGDLLPLQVSRYRYFFIIIVTDFIVIICCIIIIFACFIPIDIQKCSYRKFRWTVNNSGHVYMHYV